MPKPPPGCSDEEEEEEEESRLFYHCAWRNQSATTDIMWIYRSFIF
jgi:hypothetical protein